MKKYFLSISCDNILCYDAANLTFVMQDQQKFAAE